MFRRKPKTMLFFCALLAFAAACGSQNQVNPKLTAEMPAKFLWAWERAEDLRFLNAKEFGVAFLAQTLTLTGDEVQYRPRRQPLELPEKIYVIAVTRIETVRESSKSPTYSAEQRRKIVELIKKTLNSPNVKAIQTDFDVRQSERNFYRALINDLKKDLPADVPLTITSLASWCVGDHWFNDFPIDEAVPMAFEMGADDERIRDFLGKGNDWNEPLCRGSYGISVDDPLVGVQFKPNRRVYYFKSSAWEKRDLERLK
jgi:hypothetical protein